MRTAYLNVYRGTGGVGWLGAHWTREFADEAARSIGVERDACVEVIFEDGEGGEPESVTPAMLAAGWRELKRAGLPRLGPGPGLEEAYLAMRAVANGITGRPAEPVQAVPATEVAAGSPEGPVAKAAGRGAGTMTAAEYVDRLNAARAEFDAMTPEEQEAMFTCPTCGVSSMSVVDRRRTGRPANNDHEDDGA